MQANYFNLAFRLILKNKIYVIVNILSLGVAIGISIIAFWVNDYNRGFNDYFHDANKIYRLHKKVNGSTEKASPKINRRQFERFQKLHGKDVLATRYKLEAAIASSEDNHKSSYIVSVDDEFFDVFSFDYQHSPITNRIRPNSIILTPDLAKLLFKEQNPLGQVVQLEMEEGVYPFMVFAVLEEIPQNTSLWFDAIIPFSAYDFFQHSQPKIYDAVFYRSKDTISILPVEEALFATPLDKLPELENNLMESKFNGVIEGQVSRTAITALLLILLAAFNFLNTSISSASDRLKEIGVRKVVGATRRDLFMQIYVENIVLVFASLFIGIVLSEFFVGVYNSWWGQMKIQANFNNFSFYLYLVILLLITSLLSCAYPAFYISSFSPSEILRRQIKVVFNRYVSKMLLFGQFAITAYLIFMLTIFVQNYFFQQSFDKGFRYENIINVRIHNLKHYLGIQSVLKKDYPKVKVCGTQDLIGFNHQKVDYEINGKNESLVTYEISFNYPRFMELELIEGKWMTINKAEVVVNECFVEEYGRPESILVKGKPYKIVGIVRDFSIQNTQRGNNVEPAVLTIISSHQYKYIAVKSEDYPMQDIENRIRFYWARNVHDRIYQGFTHNRVLDFERKLNSILLKLNTFLSSIAAAISMLGLYILVSMIILKRTIEIGVRKAFGARTKDIVKLINRDYIYIIISAIFVGTISSYYASTYFLEFVFEAHAPVSVWTFFAPILTIFCISFVAVAGKILRASKRMPSKFLRNI